eukprot:TCONS_00053215-protein
MLRAGLLGKQRASLLTKSSRFLSNKTLPTSAEVVITGGGVIGTSIAYHLTQLGWKDIVILEQGSLGCGTSWHAAGLVKSIHSNHENTQQSKYAFELFDKFEQDFGIGFKKCGSLILAQHEDRALSLRKSYQMGRENGVDCHLISAQEAQQLNPLISTEGVKLAMMVPGDSVVNPTDLIQAYTKGAVKNGATKVFEGVQVLNLNSSERRLITSVDTDQGNIECGHFINAAGLWSRELGLKSQPPVQLPLHACQHFYIVTKPYNVDPMMPVTRDHDGHLYFREWSGGLMAGGFEPDAMSCFYEGIPGKFEFQLLEEDWDHFDYMLGGILKRFPSIANAEIRNFINGPESFSPDGRPHLSFAKEFDNYIALCGLSSNGIVGSPGYGKMAAELLTFGQSEHWNPYHYSVHRMAHGSNNKFLNEKVAPAILTTRYEFVYPETTYKAFPRNVLTSPIHESLEKSGAVWNQENNWEIPKYFDDCGDVRENTLGKPNWLPNVQREMKACEDSVGLIDLSSQSVFELQFDSSVSIGEFFEHFDIDPSAMAVHGKETPIFDEKDECIALVSISNTQNKRLYLRSNANVHSFLLSSLEQYAETNDVIVRDVTGSYAVFRLVGPNVDALLDKLISPPYSTEDLYKTSSMVMDIGYACDVIVMSSSIGEGWDLMIPVQFSQGLYRLLMEHGQDYGMTNVGHIAMESLRVQTKIPKVPNEVGLRTEKQFVKSIFSDKETGPVHQKSLHTIKIQVVETNWPWGGETLLHSQTREKVGSISSLGYTSDSNILKALSVVDQSKCEDGDDVIVCVGTDEYVGRIIDYVKNNDNVNPIEKFDADSIRL